MFDSLNRWFRIAVFNLFLVSCIGVVLRYKIAYALPFVDQKHLLHAHSHFAFTGWITQVLMALLVSRLYSENEEVFKKYKVVLYANLISAYGMLLSFPFQGYGPISIAFSSLSIFVGYTFAGMYWYDLNRIKQKSPADPWFKAALLFNVISSIGAFALAIMMAAKAAQPDQYLAAAYFFLHFQYNGWFFFACMGLLFFKFFLAGIPLRFNKSVFLWFALACVPAYFLSALWLPIPFWVYTVVIIAVLFQLAGGVFFYLGIKEGIPEFIRLISPLGKWLLALSAVALTIKLLLQAGSVIPGLGKIAFGFRAVIVGYLHLVLLGVITLFILGYIVINSFMRINKLAVAGVVIFISGIFLNEFILFIQGSAALSYKSVPYSNEMLFGAAIVLFLGVLVLNLSQVTKWEIHT